LGFLLAAGRGGVEVKVELKAKVEVKVRVETKA
jgi:hypothetical protein